MATGNKLNTLDFQNANVGKIEYTIPAPSSFDSQFSSMSYRLSKRKLTPIIIESPRLKTCSGIINVHGKYYMDLELQLSNVLCSQFHDFVLSIDDKNILTCQVNSIEWFSKQIEYETIEEYYKKKIDIHRSGCNPTMRVELPSRNNIITTEIYDASKNLIYASHINKGDDVVALLHLSGLRFYSKVFYPEWKIIQLKVIKNVKKELEIPHGYMFHDSEKVSDNKNDYAETTTFSEESPTQQKITTQPTSESTPEPTSKHTSEFTPEPTSKHTPESTPKSTSESTSESISESTSESTQESTLESTAEPAQKPDEDNDLAELSNLSKLDNESEEKDLDVDATNDTDDTDSEDSDIDPEEFGFEVANIESIPSVADQLEHAKQLEENSEMILKAKRLKQLEEEYKRLESEKMSEILQLRQSLLKA